MAELTGNDYKIDDVYASIDATADAKSIRMISDTSSMAENRTKSAMSHTFAKPASVSSQKREEKDSDVKIVARVNKKTGLEEKLEVRMTDLAEPKDRTIQVSVDSKWPKELSFDN